MNHSLQFAIIGCGRIASRHAAEMCRHGKLVAVCDIVKEAADTFAQKFKAKAYYSIDALLAGEKKIDVIAICTPNGLHASHSIRSLQAGIHVLCEKPMALSTADAEQMIQAAKNAEKKLYIVKQNRFNPPVMLVKELLEKQKLGRVFQFQINCFWNRPAAYYQNNWRGTRKLDGGTLFTQFSHFIDILYWLLGDVADIKSFQANFLHTGTIEFEDSGVVLLKMKNGAIGTINYSVNAHRKNMEGSFTLLGEKGTVKIGGQYLNELDYFLVENEPVPVLDHEKPSNQYGFYEGSMSNHDKVYEHLVKALADNDHAMVAADEAIKSVEIIETIYQQRLL
jgi:predicted dehydrogenase